jgi:Zn-dependent protease/CBS domain-containing protein
MWSWPFARVAGIDLKVHGSFLLVVALGAFQWGGFGLEGAVFGAVLTVLTFASVTLHELGHALVARAFRIPVKDITLYPIGGVARLGARPKTPMQEFLIALAGPAVNVVLVVVLGALGVWTVGFDAVKDALFNARSEHPSLVTLLAMLISSNAVLAVFNMLPALPMDGGRVLRAVLSGLMGGERATKISAVIARLLALALFALGLLVANPMLSIIAMFVFFGAGQEVREQRIAHVLDGVQVGDAVNPYAPRLTPATTLGEAMTLLTATHWDAFAVEHAGRFAGVVTRSALIDAVTTQGARGYVAGVMQREVPSIDPRERLEAARRSMSERDVPYVAVVREGIFLGLLTELDLAMVTERIARMRFTSDGRAEVRSGSSPSLRRR